MTAVRDIECETDQGCRILSSESVSYSDGAEDRVFDVIRGARDISSTSDELADQATSWAERYHLSTARANVLRAFRVPAGAVALEVGAGCGAITRYLGEQCAAVDALEPVLARARAARERVRDLDHVEVFIGSVFDIPPLPTYDLVFVVGVLEYIGGGAPGLEAQRMFLHQIHALLRPGGTLILAIENKLGVKYLAGAGEDHTGRVYDSVEAYPEGTIARTFSRGELVSLLQDAELAPDFYAVFSDYKLTRAVMSDQLFETVPALGWRIPQFPSPDRVGRSAKTISEERLWRSFVQDGTGGNFGNSFVVAAQKAPADDGPLDARLWPQGQLAAFYQPDRRVKYATETRVFLRDGDVVFARCPISQRSAVGAETLHPAFAESVLVDGHDLLELMEEADDDELAILLKRWMDVADSVAGDSGKYHADLLPHNLVQANDGNLLVIDEESMSWPLSRSEVLARSALITAWKLAIRTPPSRWPGTTFGDAVLHVGGMLGLDPADGWLEVAVTIEARLETEMLVRTGWDMKAPTQVESVRRGFHEALGMPLSELPLGDRDHETLAQYRQWLDQANDAYEQTQQTVDRMAAERDAILASSSWRLTKPVRSLARATNRLRERTVQQKS